MNSTSPLCLVENLQIGYVSRLWVRCLLTTGLGLLVSSALAQAPDLEIGVRSKVTDGMPKWNDGKTEADGGHPMIYGILAIKQVENVQRLVRPVDEKRVTSILMDTLDANGFREFLPGEKPEILITASYGRGEMTNPYIRDTGAVGGATSSANPASRAPSPMDSQAAGDGLNMGADGSLPTYGGVGGTGHGAGGQGPQTSESAPLTSTITGASAIQLFDEKGQGYESKLQKAAFEKLFIRITAWEYPDPTAQKKTRPKMLWKTVIVVDDPDHRDLNQVAQAMLEAAGPWFDKLHSKPEVEVHKPLPTGKVIVGPTEVREPFRLPSGR